MHTISVDKFYIESHKYPNKYNLRVSDIENLRVLDWSKLAVTVMRMPNSESYMPFYHHAEGCNLEGDYCYDDEFWIMFDAGMNTINYRFTKDRGMTSYVFDEFYDPKTIDRVQDFGVQVNALRFLTDLIDEGILGLPA